MSITLVLLALLAIVFLKGFKEAIRLATAVCIPYLVLNVIVLVRALFAVISHPVAMPHWLDALRAQGSWAHVGIAAVILFPQLALGLSGFETGVSVMPLIRGAADDNAQDRPYGRIRNTRKLLITAAVIMSVLLIVSSFVTALLIPPEAYREGGPASGRAIAFMAHQYLGNVFGSVYDISTILILWFAGASAMAGLLHLVPRYLPRVGLAPQWVADARPLVLVLFAFDVVITLAFHANVEAQGGAYATGVLVLMFSATVASAISLWKEKSRWTSLYCWAVVVVFAYTTVVNMIERTDGIIIASIFHPVHSAGQWYQPLRPLDGAAGRGTSLLRCRIRTHLEFRGSRKGQSCTRQQLGARGAGELCRTDPATLPARRPACLCPRSASR